MKSLEINFKHKNLELLSILVGIINIVLSISTNDIKSINL